MEQQLDAFTQRKFDLMLEMATKKLQSEINSMKESLCSMAGDINSLKSQISRLQFQPQNAAFQTTLSQHQTTQQPQMQQQRKEVKIVDCRPENERKEEFQSGAARNSEQIRPRYGDYEPKDVSIEKFFYFGKK